MESDEKDEKDEENYDSYDEDDEEDDRPLGSIGVLQTIFDNATNEQFNHQEYYNQYNWDYMTTKDIDNPELKIIFTYFCDDDYEAGHLEQWLINPNTDIKIYELICRNWRDAIGNTIDDVFLLKDTSNITETAFEHLCGELESDIDVLLPLYERFSNKGFLHWCCIYDSDKENYFKISSKLNFDPFFEIDKRIKRNYVVFDYDGDAKTELIEDTIGCIFGEGYLVVKEDALYQLLHCELSIYEQTLLINFIKKLSSPRSNIFAELVGSGQLNHLMNSLTDEIDNCASSLTIAYDACRYENYQVIDYLRSKVPYMDYVIVTKGTKAVIENYFPGFNQLTIDEIMRKID